MTRQSKMKALLEKVGLPFIEIEVFGNQITIECKAEKTAQRWSGVLCRFAKIRGVIQTTKENKVNKNTVMLPTRHPIYRVYAAM